MSTPPGGWAGGRVPPRDLQLIGKNKAREKRENIENVEENKEKWKNGKGKKENEEKWKKLFTFRKPLKLFRV